MTTYTNPYTGQTIQPSQVGYESLTISANEYLQWPVNGNTSDVVANIIEITATVGGLFVYMPPATQVSVGQTTLIKNVGSNAFTVVDNSGNTIITIASGIAQYIYLTNNLTVNGTWSTVTFGAGTSAASASALAGAGLQAITTTLNQAYNVSKIYSNYTLQNSDRASVLAWEGGVGTITLPSSSVLGSSWFVTVKNDGTGILTLTPSGTDTIDGASTFQLQYSESLTIVSTGSGWVSYGYGQSSTFFFTILSKIVTGGTVTLTPVEASNLIQEYSGTLTSNCTVILPSTVQLYSMNNQTSGAFTLTFKTTAVGGTTVSLPQGQTIVLICDGTNVYSAQTATTSVISTFTLTTNGSASAPSLNWSSDTQTGLYLAATGQLGIAVGGNVGAIFTSSGLLVPTGISGGTF
jgi:hypothetical protein